LLTVKQLLQADGLDVAEDQIKLVRHVNHLNRSITRIIDEGHFDFYQTEQSPTVKPFHNCEVLLSFIGIEGNKAEFYGAYEVLGYRDFTKNDLKQLPDWLVEAHKDGQPRIKYELRELEQYRSYRKRLIVQWKSTRGWHQKKDLGIYELLPAMVTELFPGYQEVLLSFEALKKIFADDRAHRDWKAALRANAGIYRIVDLSTGEIYIGSAYGREGIWGRWQNYAKTGHGGNKLLRGRDPNNFQWSIVRTVSTTMSERDVIRIENLEKEKHGSRAIGLNEN
jgi:hypothetical protein